MTPHPAIRTYYNPGFPAKSRAAEVSALVSGFSALGSGLSALQCASDWFECAFFGELDLTGQPDFGLPNDQANLIDFRWSDIACDSMLRRHFLTYRIAAYILCAMGETLLA